MVWRILRTRALKILVDRILVVVVVEAVPHRAEHHVLPRHLLSIPGFVLQNELMWSSRSFSSPALAHSSPWPASATTPPASWSPRSGGGTTAPPSRWSRPYWEREAPSMRMRPCLSIDVPPARRANRAIAQMFPTAALKSRLEIETGCWAGRACYAIDSMSVVAVKSAEVALSASATPFFTSPHHFGHFGLCNHSYSVVRKQVGGRRGAGDGRTAVW